MSVKISDVFNSYVFTDAEMKARLPKSVYEEVKKLQAERGIR